MPSFYPIHKECKMSQNRNTTLSSPYDLLGIPPTNNWGIVKKAYYIKALACHPDKNPNDRIAAEEKFKKLQAAWSKIDTEEKLNRFYANHLAGNVSDFLPHSFSPTQQAASSSSAAPLATDMQAYSTAEVDIFIPVPFAPNTTQTSANGPRVFLPKINSEQRKHFNDTVNLSDIATVITALSALNDMQIGVTRDEALAIVNQHSHYCPMLIIQARISLTRLSDDRLSEKDKFGPNLLSARDDKRYLWLLQNSQFASSNILSISAMNDFDYRNSIRFSSHLFKNGENHKDYWPAECLWQSRPSLKAGESVSEHDHLIIAATTEVTKLENSLLSFLNNRRVNQLKAAIKSGDDDTLRQVLGLSAGTTQITMAEQSTLVIKK